MIELKDVSTYRLFWHLRHVSSDVRAYRTITKHGIRDYQTLKNMIDNGEKGFDNEILESYVRYVEQSIEYANEIGREPVFFPTNDYANSDVCRETLKYTDKHNTCDKLILRNPTVSFGGKYAYFRDSNIYDLKILLNKVAGHGKSNVGKNAFIEAYRKIGMMEAEKVRNAINFYEEQVLRQASETNKDGINLFTLNRDKKEFIVRNDIKNIVMYLLDNAEVCVWGKLSDTQRNKLLSAVTRWDGIEDRKIRKRVIKMIANYTTLSELEAGVVKQKTLDRFIVK